MSGRAAHLAYRAGADVARALPSALGTPLVRALSRSMPVVMPARRREVARNLALRCHIGEYSGQNLQLVVEKRVGAK